MSLRDKQCVVCHNTSPHRRVEGAWFCRPCIERFVAEGWFRVANADLEVYHWTRAGNSRFPLFSKCPIDGMNVSRWEPLANLMTPGMRGTCRYCRLEHERKAPGSTEQV